MRRIRVILAAAAIVAVLWMSGGLRGSSITGPSGPSITSGTYAALPATCAQNDLYLFSSGWFNAARCKTANTWGLFAGGIELTTIGPVAASWTLAAVAGGGAAKGDDSGTVTLVGTTSAFGVEALNEAVPSAPYVQTWKFSIIANHGTGNNWTDLGVMWMDGSTNTAAVDFCGVRYSEISGTTSPTFASTWDATSYALAGFTPGTVPVIPPLFNPAAIYVQVEDNSTNRICRVSNDGKLFLTIRSRARTTPFTPTRWGWGWAQVNGAATDVSRSAVLQGRF